ncbi:aldehyde reductase [Tothia fuscella]|uniref:Aldehyde reductase n=1 Tax=Tothia fuscella TaxID=1048955 RepID=A0A9P4TX62_9PEZI|nr:aldehyde reductase [Tothia fuscella]
MTTTKNPALPPGSLVLITGVNGFIGSHVADQTLRAGYKVRGTVRDVVKNKWVQDLFGEAYGKGNFELVEIKDFTAEGVYDEVLNDVSGVIHTASILSFDPNPHVVVTPTIAAALNIVKAAVKFPNIKRVVYTSSSTAASMPLPNKEFTIDAKSWNEHSIKEAWRHAPYEQSRAVDVYGASKAQAEQALWKFMEEEKPGFVLNTVLPDTTFGKSLDPVNQGHPSTSSFPGLLLSGVKENMEFWLNALLPQYFVDVEDVGILHVVGLTHPEVSSERIFAYAEPFTFNDILDVFRKNFPDRKILDDFVDLSRDLSIVPPRERAEELLKEFGQEHGFKSLEESVLANVEGM